MRSKVKDKAVFESAAKIESEVRERDRSEIALRASEDRLRAVAESANDAIVSADEHGNITFINRSTERIFGYSSAEAVGQPLTILMPDRLHKAHRMGLHRYLKDGTTRVIGTKTVEVVGRRRDGTEFPVELSLAAWKFGDQPNFTGILRDITERKRATEALRSHMEELARSNAELEHFVNVASRDLQEPLQMVSSSAQLLAERYRGRLDPDADEVISHLVEGAERMQQLIDDLLSSSRTRARTETREGPATS